MKKTILLLAVVFAFSFSANAQESKAYLGVSVGVAFPGGDTENLETGLSLGLVNFGYRFNESWGAVLNWGSSGHNLKEGSGTFGIGYLAIGPMYTVDLNEKVSLDIKPQYAFRMAAETDGAGASDDFTSYGSGMLLGTSFNFGVSKGFKFSINLDYLSGTFDEEEYEGQTYDTEDFDVTCLSIGAGVRYNF